MYFDHIEAAGKIHSLESEIELIKMYGSRVIAVALNAEDCSKEEARAFQQKYEAALKIPVILPLEEGCDRLVPLLRPGKSVA